MWKYSTKPIKHNPIGTIWISSQGAGSIGTVYSRSLVLLPFIAKADPPT